MPLVGQRTRCPWATTPLSIAYHDREWGVPVHDDRVHFEFLTLEGAQAGLSWETILRKREGYRRLFADFDPARVARFSDAKMEKSAQDPAIVRHRGKIASAVNNARAFLKVQREFRSFDKYVWPFAARVAEALSKDLRSRGFTFVGPTIVYAYMQAVGLVNDHAEGCFRRS